MARVLFRMNVTTPEVENGHRFGRFDSPPTVAIHTNSITGPPAEWWDDEFAGSSSTTDLTPVGDASEVRAWIESPQHIYWVSGATNGTWSAIHPSDAVFVDLTRHPYKAKGGTDITAVANTAVRDMVAAGVRGTLWIPPDPLHYRISREEPFYAAPAGSNPNSQFGGIRLWNAAGIRILGEQTVLDLYGNNTIFDVRSMVNWTNGANGLPYAVVTADIAVGQNWLVVDERAQVSVGDTVHIELNQSVDLGEPTYWLRAHVLAITAGSGLTGTITIDQELTQAVTVAGITDTRHKSVRRYVGLSDNVRIDGFDLRNDLVNGFGYTGIQFSHVQNCRVDNITAQNTGAGLLIAQYCENLRGINHRVPTMYAQFPAQGTLYTLAESRNCEFDTIYGEQFEGPPFVVEAGCENIVWRNAFLVNNFDLTQPQKAITPPATAQNQFTYSAGVPAYVGQGSWVRLTGGANPQEILAVNSISGSTVTLYSNILNAGHTTAQIVRNPTTPALNVNDPYNNGIVVENLSVTGKSMPLVNEANAGVSAVEFRGSLIINSNPADADAAFGQVPLDQVSGLLIVNRTTYRRKRSASHFIYLNADGSNATSYSFPRGRIAHVRVWLSTLTGVTGVYTSAFDESLGYMNGVLYILPVLLAGQWVDVAITSAGPITLLNGGHAAMNHNDQNGLIFYNDGTLPAGAFALVDFDYWVADAGGYQSTQTDTTLASGLPSDFSDGIPIGSHGLLLPGHLVSGGAKPTAAAGANAGTSPPAPAVNTRATDSRGSLTFGTGTGPAAGAQAVVTFAATYDLAPFVTIAPVNAATAALQPYVSATAAGSFTVAFGVAPAANQANTVYGFSYQVSG